jgi:pimeloyl-ACP methyl ester carboxylesterase
MVACASATPTPGSTSAPAIDLRPCQLSSPGSPDRVKAECGTLTVFENRAAGSGRTIELRVAVLKALSRNPAPDPLFFLTGGPGQAATESYVQLSGAFDKINQTRDIVLVDQRGTGQSRPLRCPVGGDDFASDDSDEKLKAFLEDCLKQFDADPKLYTTSIAMDDLDQVRAALGYDKINLYGVSYGTRAALTYLRQYPQRVRTVILDGVVPSDAALGLDVARDAQRALDLIFARCAADPACQAAFPNLKAEFDALSAHLAAQSAKISLTHPVTGQPTEITLTHGLFASSLRLLSYSPETVALLPLLIHKAQAKGDLRLFAAQALMVNEQLNQSISSGMDYSVLCAEDAPFITTEAAAQSNAGTYLGDQETGNLQKICAVWPRGNIPADFKQPVTSDVPVLLLSGEADPVTPPTNADRAAQTLAHSLRLVAPGQGHNVIARGCMTKLATTFVESGSVQGLKTDCVQNIQPMPFFISFSGPPP